MTFLVWMSLGFIIQNGRHFASPEFSDLAYSVNGEENHMTFYRK